MNEVDHVIMCPLQMRTFLCSFESHSPSYRCGRHPDVMIQFPVRLAGREHAEQCVAAVAACYTRVHALQYYSLQVHSHVEPLVRLESVQRHL